jgi:hypothetical protein
MVSPKLPLYLRSNVSKEIDTGSLVVNPNVDYRVYKVLVVSKKHMLAIDEKLVLHKFKIKNFIRVSYIFAIQSEILTSENILSTSVSVSEDLFNVCKSLISQNNYCEVFNLKQTDHIEDKCALKIDSKIFLTSNRLTTSDHHDEKDRSISWIDHYATIKLKNSKEKIYLSFARNAKIERT